MVGIKRVAGKVVVVVGGGQAPGQSVGNGRAAALLYAREGARVLVVDRDPESARETASMIEAEGGVATSLGVDVKREDDLERMVSACVKAYGRLDILHNNVGISKAGGDAPVTETDPAAFTHVMEVNLRGMVLACKHALPVMREQKAGVIINIASVAAIINYPLVAYKTSKAGVVSLTEHLAITNAQHGIRANVILPGLIDTPMAVEPQARESGLARQEVVARRSERTPLKVRPGSAWDVAHAALFLASDEAAFITGTALTVDGGQSLVVG